MEGPTGRRAAFTLVLPARGAPPCACGAGKVSVFQDGLVDLMDNMGCELGLERLGGPLCPTCDAAEVRRLRDEPPG